METFLIRCYLWAREVPWSDESTNELLGDLATFLSERGFRNDDDGQLHCILVAGTAELPEDDVWFEELTSDPTVDVVVIPNSGGADE